MPGLGHRTAARCGNTAFPIASGCLKDKVRLRDVPKRELRRRAAFKETGRIGSDIIRLDEWLWSVLAHLRRGPYTARKVTSRELSTLFGLTDGGVLAKISYQSR